MGRENGLIEPPDMGLVFEEEKRIGKGAGAIAATKALGAVGEAF